MLVASRPLRVSERGAVTFHRYGDSVILSDSCVNERQWLSDDLHSVCRQLSVSGRHCHDITVCVWVYQRVQFILWLIGAMFDFFRFLTAEQNQIWSSNHFRCDTCISCKQSIDHIRTPKTFYTWMCGEWVAFDRVVFVRRPCERNDLNLIRSRPSGITLCRRIVLSRFHLQRSSLA